MKNIRLPDVLLLITAILFVAKASMTSQIVVLSMAVVTFILITAAAVGRPVFLIRLAPKS